MSARVHLKHYSSTMRALQSVDKGTAKTIKDELKQAGETVAEEARRRISVYPGARTAQIGPRATNRGVFVTQRARKVTGQRGDFGALQMGHLIDALDEKEDDVIRGVEAAFDRLADRHGF
jgi:hypothetical protein